MNTALQPIANRPSDPTTSSLPLWVQRGHHVIVTDELRAAVQAVIDAADPVGLLEMGAPPDEYRLEVGDLVALVLSGQTSADRVRAVLTRWFGTTQTSEAK